MRVKATKHDNAWLCIHEISGQQGDISIDYPPHAIDISELIGLAH
jgi:hypothetical protein